MMLLNTPPGPDEAGLMDYYRRCAAEGTVFSGAVENQSYGLSESFDPSWSVASICWCAGGAETYEFQGGETLHLRAGAVLVIGEQERYAWSAQGEKAFTSSMIVFPVGMTRSLRQPVLDHSDDSLLSPAIETGLFRPGRHLVARLNLLAAAAGTDSPDSEAIEEQATLVAQDVLAMQAKEHTRPEQLDSVKKTTREELCRRLRKAVILMHDAYSDSSLDLATLAREACIARHHFVRVFSAAYGITPLRYLCEIRMEAAARLLEAVDISAGEVATAVGFDNRSAFHRRFKQYFGVTPAAWPA